MTGVNIESIYGWIFLFRAVGYGLSRCRSACLSGIGPVLAAYGRYRLTPQWVVQKMNSGDSRTCITIKGSDPIDAAYTVNTFS